ncbi:hypothetical protein [Fluviispira sanaruensis]|uniref:Uncharacterized protein n=1 Tax=Fluviispira sanaruensis TaxID=2493639 RepID=A0A4P2VKJ2_FLUSA|nr:hypothetical protein [Fluviispira sanaruensis]BBH52200.1 hypothetical protein JCM31447_314900 [Fluviispira sanaruensis]
MKKIIIVIISCTIFFSLVCAITIYTSIRNLGAIKIENSTQTSLKIVGKVELKKSAITEKADVIGKVKVFNSTLNNIKTIGFLNLHDNSKVNGDIKVTGNLFMSLSRIEKQLNITSENIEINDNSYVRSIFVNKDEDNKEEVISIDNSIVDGNIEFESQHGKVKLKNGAKVTGTVIGGTVDTI